MVPFDFNITTFTNHTTAINIPEVRGVLADSVGLDAVRKGWYCVIWSERDAMFHIYW